MSDLTELPNIGDKLAELLRLSGIGSAEELRNIGSREAFLRLQAVDPEV